MNAMNGKILHLILITLLLFAACDLKDPFNDDREDKKVVNLPPETHIFLLSDVDSTGTQIPFDTTSSQKIVHWWGDDPERHRWITRDLADFRIANGRMWHTDSLEILRDTHDFSAEGYELAHGPRVQRQLVAFGALLNERGLDVTCVTPCADRYRMLRGETPGRDGIVRF